MPNFSGTSAPIEPAINCEGRATRRIRVIVGVGLAIAAAAYFSWRLTVFNASAPVVSLTFYLIELLGFATTCVSLIVVFRRRRRSPRPAPPGLAVDIFVTTYNEEIDVVRRTLVATLAVRYPHETWLLDDGSRQQFRALAEELGCRYHARGNNRGAKAGNLNAALKHAKGEFFAVFDADHCPQPDFLDRLLGYFEDADVAFVQSPQDYFNHGSFAYLHGQDGKTVWHAQTTFNHPVQAGRDYLDAATMCGCSAIMRRAHIDLIGGFPEDTVTEDMHVAVKLHKRGLRSVYHDEPLAYGVSAQGYGDFFRQRLRWGEGNMQVCRLEGLPFSRDLKPGQNLCYLMLGMPYTDSLRKLALYVAPPLSLLTGVPPIHGEPAQFFLIFLPYLLMSWLASIEFYGGFARIWGNEVYDAALMTPGIVAMRGLFLRRIQFKVTSKSLNAAFPALLLAPQWIVLGLSLAAAVVTILGWLAVASGRAATGIPHWIEAVMLVVTVYHALVMIAVLRIARRAAKGTRAQYDHLVQVACTNLQTGQTAATRSLAIDRATVSAAWPEGRTEIELILPDGPLAVPARLERAGEQTIAWLQWSDQRLRDRLDCLLHASRWHRIVAGRSEISATLSQRLGLTPGYARIVDRPKWEAAVIRHAKGERGCAYVDVRRGAALVFGVAPRPEDRIVPVVGDQALAMKSNFPRPRSFLDMRGLDHLDAKLIAIGALADAGHSSSDEISKADGLRSPSRGSSFAVIPASI
jgi:cellulose synthase (UDP-forming)